MFKVRTWVIAGAAIIQMGAGNLIPVGRMPDALEQSTAGKFEPATAPITPLPLKLELDLRKVELGRRLFHDPGLSSNGSVSCASCHRLNRGGVDRLPQSLGISGKIGSINAPTVFNSGFNFRQFWDGRAVSLEEQINGPLQNPVEMANTWSAIIASLEKDPKYRKAFSAIYRTGIQPGNVRDAIATYERSLVTPNARFDRFLRGDKSALDNRELAGYRLFRQAGCISCHQGVNIGGNLFQKLGIMEDYFAARGRVTSADMGLFNVTGKEVDRHFFKVPSLRNVALTTPYLHDGSALTLEDAVRIMGRYQLGKELHSDEVDKIVAFLKTLTGEYQGKTLQ